ncbi:hypothetical protein HY772_07585 [Candidatus Woesearchaeota archaeon]|nr:hypothetical protein [Candidatus Woesearchaeota archaeon]
MTNNKINLQLTLTMDNATSEALVNETTTLMQYLNASHLDLSASLIKNETDIGQVTKGDPITWGALLLVVAPAVLPQILSFLEKMITEGRKIEIQAPNGAKIVYVSKKKMSKKEIMRFLKELNKVKPSK